MRGIVSGRPTVSPTKPSPAFAPPGSTPKRFPHYGPKRVQVRQHVAATSTKLVLLRLALLLLTAAEQPAPVEAAPTQGHSAARHLGRPVALYQDRDDRKWHGAREPKYHLYNPEDLIAYRSCELTHYCRNHKHNIDKLLINQLLQEGKSVPPEDADIFIVPALLSQVLKGCCKHRESALSQMTQFLKRSPWFQRYNGSDHFVVGDDSNIRNPHWLPGKVTVGRYEVIHPEMVLDHPFVAVGYSTRAALIVRGWTRSDQAGIDPIHLGAKPFAERAYDFSFVGKADSRSAYRDRRALACAWKSKGGAYRHRAFVHVKGDIKCMNEAGSIEQAHSPALAVSKAEEILRESRFFLALTGDAPTTNRLASCFETLTIPVVLSHRLQGLMDALPFLDVIPWRDILVVVETAAWIVDPLRSVADTIDSLPPEEVTMRRQLMKRHADDMSFANPQTTRMHRNIIHAAWRLMMERLKAMYEPVHMPSSSHFTSAGYKSGAN
mmetsp:Transcript_20847/g.52497  ORF Transcript_20847/g.52497 Transcript_20847/m.52497 type:complete len:493 (+) Transcript_20847:109-1587(+)